MILTKIASTKKNKAKNIKNVTVAAGVLIKFNDKILLTKPAKSTKKNTWGIPKGKLEYNETYSDAAFRETKEEIGITLDKNKLIKYSEIVYKNIKTKIPYKKIYYFVYEISSLDEIDLDSEVIPKEQLSLREIKKAKFFTKEKALKFIFPKQIKILDHI